MEINLLNSLEAHSQFWLIMKFIYFSFFICTRNVPIIIIIICRVYGGMEDRQRTLICDRQFQ